MNEYKVVFKLDNGFIGNEIVYAVNKVAAYETFEQLGYKNIVAIECYRVLEKSV